MKTGFSIKKSTVTNGAFTYATYRLTGWLNGKRIRKQFKDRAEADGEKQRLEVEAANTDSAIRAMNTRLTSQQIAEAESAFARLAGKSLSAAVDWYLTTYKAPVTNKPLSDAAIAFLADRKAHVRARQLRDYTDTLRLLGAAVPGRTVDAITTADVQTFLDNRKVGKKRHNNLRGDLHTFFTYCKAPPREWCRDNPVEPVAKFKISRGVPEILDADTCAKLMTFLESYAGGPRSKHSPGYLVPYFALCLFAGLRPSIRDGEVRKLADSPNAGTFLDVALGVIRITPEISKVKCVRRVTIQPNLAAWLVRYPLKKYPIIVANMDAHAAVIREKFAIGGDVLRHTFLSMHVGKFRSMGDAALEAGNSEAMIKKHYLNMVSKDDAEKFWSIAPSAQPLADVIPIAATG